MMWAKRLVVVGVLAAFPMLGLPASAGAKTDPCKKAIEAADKLIALQAETVGEVADLFKQIDAAPSSLFVATVRTGMQEVADHAKNRQSAIDRSETRFHKFARKCTK